MDISANNFKLNNLGKVSLILGKNGCGKSTLLKNFEQHLSGNNSYGKIKYINPERGGKLSYDPGIENTIARNERWLGDTRRNNQLGNFREQSVAQFRNLELLFLRELQDTESLRMDLAHRFDKYFNKINSLLDNVQIRKSGNSFKIFKKNSPDEEINPGLVSSGESELISLGIECLVFEKECVDEKTNILFLDEPDVHLHPDLQERLCHFLYDLIKNKNALIVLSTHSTAILGALQNYDDTHIEFMLSGQKELNFIKISEEYRRILPIFGAHPLSNIFNRAPIYLVEGDDDERIWQQAVRSSDRKLKIYPCSADGIDNMKKYESDINKIIAAVYENGKAFSLRDKDDGESNIDDNKSIVRFKLECRSSENLLLSNDVLKSLETTWEELKNNIDLWIEKNTSHIHYDNMLKFKNSSYDRKNFKLKEIRNDIMHIIGKEISWEVAIGKIIGKIFSGSITYDHGDNDSIVSYLGEKLFSSLKFDG